MLEAKTRESQPIEPGVICVWNCPQSTPKETTIQRSGVAQIQGWNWIPARGSGRWHKAWGGAQRNPRILNTQLAEPAKRPIGVR
jgi:hypothetical protein